MSEFDPSRFQLPSTVTTEAVWSAFSTGQIEQFVVDRQGFMSAGPGRFLTLDRVPLIQSFFSDPNRLFGSGATSSGRTSFSLSEVREAFALTRGDTGRGDITAKINNSKTGVYDADYGERTFVW